MHEEKRQTGSGIATIFNICFSAIGGRDNLDIIDYFASRKQKITRAAFFKNVVWAVWVTGMSRKATPDLLKRKRH